VSPAPGNNQVYVHVLRIRIFSTHLASAFHCSPLLSDLHKPSLVLDTLGLAHLHHMVVSSCEEDASRACRELRLWRLLDLTYLLNLISLTDDACLIMPLVSGRLLADRGRLASPPLDAGANERDASLACQQRRRITDVIPLQTCLLATVLVSLMGHSNNKPKHNYAQGKAPAHCPFLWILDAPRSPKYLSESPPRQRAFLPRWGP